MCHPSPQSELKPCPFCGEKEALQVGYGLLERGGYPAWVQCQTCQACGPLRLEAEQDKSSPAQTAWNGRS